MKNLLFFSLLLFSCNFSESDRIGEENYQKFKVSISQDSLSVFADEYANNVVLFHSDKAKVSEAVKWLEKRKEYEGKREAALLMDADRKEALLESSFKVIEALHVKRGCNYYQAHLLIKPLTSNRDSLLQATKVFLDKTFLSIPYEGDCSGNPTKCLISLYESKSDFELNGIRKWLTNGSRITGEEAKVQYSYYK